MKIRYHKQIVDILYKEWDLGKTASKAKGKTCAWIYWFEILGEAEEIIVEKINDTIIGVCGYTKWHSKRHIIRKKIDADYDYLPKCLENYFDGEITILIVDKQYRGRQLGKKLLNKIFEMARNDGMKNIQILSDESCNYQFYEALGCIKVYEKDIPNGEPDKCGNVTEEKGFIYEKKLEI